MKNNLIIITLLMSSRLFAQPIPRQSIEDSMIGWMKVYNFNGVKEPRTLGDNTFSIHQLSFCDSFTNRMLISYIPKGTLQDVRELILPQTGFYIRHQAFGTPG